MDLFARWLVAQVRARLRNERGDVLIVLLLIFLIWLVVTGRKVVVQ